MTEGSDGSPGPRPALRLSTACGLVPMALGSLGFFGWLISTGGTGSEGDLFIMLGIAALGGGPVLFVIGLGALAVARRRGAPTRPLVRRALLLFANFPLAAIYLLGLGVAAIQRVEVVNLGDVAIQDVTVVACRSARHEAEELGPGERLVWRFTPPSEGMLQVSARRSGELLTLEDGCMFFIFMRKDVLVEMTADGEWQVTEAEGAPWSWVPGR